MKDEIEDPASFAFLAGHSTVAEYHEAHNKEVMAKFDERFDAIEAEYKRDLWAAEDKQTKAMMDLYTWFNQNYHRDGGEGAPC